MQMFPEGAPSAPIVFFNAYSHNAGGKRETWKDVCDRAIAGIKKLGKLTEEEAEFLWHQQYNFKCLVSGRSLWTSGREWIENPKNFPGAYNCTSLRVNSLEVFGLLMELSMMGCGTGAVLTEREIARLPAVRNRLKITSISEIGSRPAGDRREKTKIELDPTLVSHSITIRVGDSREGWVSAYQELLNLAFDKQFVQRDPIEVAVDLSSVRPAGEKLKGFGGIANPIKLPELFEKCAKILNEAFGRRLNSVECCLLIDEAALVVVAGNVRRSAGIRLFDRLDEEALVAKDNLWVQNESGTWQIDPKRDALRMANHSRLFDREPTLEELKDAVKRQHKSGEGAIEWEGEAIARCNSDLWAEHSRSEFLAACKKGEKERWLRENIPSLTEEELDHRLSRSGLNPCVTADTWVHTEFGARQVKDLIGKQHGTCVNGELFSTTPEGFFCTGDRRVLVLTTKEGYSLKLTSNHQILKISSQTQKAQYSEWIAAGDLKPGDRICLHNHRGIEPWAGAGNLEEGWLLGQLVGNGSLAETEWSDRAILRFWGVSKEEEIERAVTALKKNVTCGANLAGHYHRQIDLQQVSSAGLARLAAEFGINRTNKTLTEEVERASSDFYRGFLRGLFDSDGCVQGSTEKGVSIRLSQSNIELLYRVQRMLARLGIISTVYKNRREAGYRSMPDSNRNAADYWCKASHELAIANDNLTIYRDEIGFWKLDKRQRLDELLGAYKRKLNRERFTATVQSIDICGVEPVYDCTVPGVGRFDANGIVAHNCGEILGADFMCNLSEVHLNQIDPQSLEEQRDAFKAGALIVSAFLHHKFENPRLQRSRELDPIVGVSFTGLFDFFVSAFGIDWLRWWQAGRPESYEVDRVSPAIEAICAQFNVDPDDCESPEGIGWNFGSLFRDLERIYLENWRETVENSVRDYCERHGLKRPNRCTTVQPAGCLTKDAVRAFDLGLLFADEHMEPGSEECDLETESLSVRDGIPVLTGIANEERNDLIRVTLENGRQLTMTPNHRLSVSGEWICAAGMGVGQELDFKIGTYNSAEEALLECTERQQECKERQEEASEQQKPGAKRGPKGIKCDLPSQMSPELGYFIGCLFGNGYMSGQSYRIRFCHGNEKVLEQISNLGMRLFGLKGRLHKDGHGGYRELAFSNKSLYQWFVENGIHKPVKSKDLERIPQKLRRSSKQSLLAFFAGLIDTDGCIRKDGGLSIASASEPFLRHLQQIGEAVGLSFSLYANTKGENYQEAKAMFELAMSKTESLGEAIVTLNRYSIKAQSRTIQSAKRSHSFYPYKIAKVERGIVGFTYDYAVEGEGDDDSWYWQGAIKSHNTKSLLTGASPGWHPPKSSRFIRRITTGKNNSVALAAIDCGYSVIPSQSDKDENGQLLVDPFDGRCTEWLIEIPTQTAWASLPGVQDIDISKFSAEAQFDFYMQVQRFYATHNTSATIEVRETETDGLAGKIFEAIHKDKGYVSAAILARFDDLESYPRLPFEPISKETYDRLCREVASRRSCDDFYEALSERSSLKEAEGPAPCDSDKCLRSQSGGEKP